jgi:hypothetical protein
LIEKIQQYCAGKMFAGFISLFQKLIDVQQTLIENPNPLKKIVSTNPGKAKIKSDISQLLFFNISC